MRISLFSAAILFLTLCAGSSTAQACVCITPPEQERFKKSAVVFEGEVVLVLHRKGHPEARVGYVFKVTKTLKGKPVTEVTIFTNGTNCDAEFVLDAAYRVYAHQFDGKLRSSICSGNKYLYSKKRSSRQPTRSIKEFEEPAVDRRTGVGPNAEHNKADYCER